MNAGSPKRRNVMLKACLPVILAAAGCTQETHLVGSPEVRFQCAQTQLVAAAKILRDGEHVGTVRTVRVHGPTGDRTVHQVKDNYLNSLGFIDEKNCAYRLSAHTGAEFVANNADRRRNVAAILGAYGSNIELIEEEPAAELQKSASDPAPPRPR